MSRELKTTAGINFLTAITQFHYSNQSNSLLQLLNFLTRSSSIPYWKLSNSLLEIEYFLTVKIYRSTKAPEKFARQTGKPVQTQVARFFHEIQSRPEYYLSLWFIKRNNCAKLIRQRCGINRAHGLFPDEIYFLNFNSDFFVGLSCETSTGFFLPFANNLQY